jgi:hypothetical protein
MNEAEFVEEAQTNSVEFKEFVQSIDMKRAGRDEFIFDIVLLEGNNLTLHFQRYQGYLLGTMVYESMQALLSSQSPKFRAAFVSALSKRLNEKMKE